MLDTIILRHSKIEGPGLIEEILIERGIEYCIIDAQELKKAPTAQVYIVMGGPMSANDNNQWTQRELEAIRWHVNNDGYFLGVCLGAQMLAKALGGKVRAGKREVGNYTATLTENGQKHELTKGLGCKIPVFQWHGETFTTPPGGRVLAKANGMAQMFAYKKAVGMQFHLEARREMIEKWIKGFPFYASKADKTNQRVLEEFATNCGLYGYAAREIFGRFLDRAGR